MFEYRGRYTDEQKENLKSIIHTLSPAEIEIIEDDWWNIWGRADQTMYLDNDNWKFWLMMKGRGGGKTRSGVGWAIWKMMNSHTPLRGAVVCPTDGDVVGTIIDGESGFMSKSPKSFYPIWHKKDNSLTFPNGSIIRCFSSESPDRLRGPNFHFSWGDEVAVWKGMDKGDTSVIDMLLFATRIGIKTQILWTTTPQNIPWLRNVLKDSKDPANRTIVTKGSTYENSANLTSDYLETLKQKYEGTKLGLQEIYGEVLDLESNAQIKKEWFQIWSPRKPLPAFNFIVASLDTGFTEKTINDPSACIVAGVFWDPNVNDYSVMILDWWEQWLIYPDLKHTIKKSVWERSHGNDGMNPGRQPAYLIIENRGSGQSLIQDLVNDGINCVPTQPQVDKGERLSYVSHLVEEKRVYVMGGLNTTYAVWVERLVEDICNYPAVTHDDSVDAFSQLLKNLKDSKWVATSGVYRRRPSLEKTEQSPRSNPYAQ